MQKSSSTNRVRSILLADAVDFSNSIQKHKQQTIDAISASRALFATNATVFHGEIVDTTGDGVLAVFNTNHAAVQCALAVQQALKAARTDTRAGCTPTLEYRIAVCEGALSEKPSGLFGSAINLAARLQALTRPGCVGLSEEVFQSLAPYLRVFQPRRIAGVPKTGAPAICGVELDPESPADIFSAPHDAAVSGNRVRTPATVALLVNGAVDSDMRDRLLNGIVDQLLSSSFDVRVVPGTRSVWCALSAAGADDRIKEDYIVALGAGRGCKRSLALSVYCRQSKRFLLSRHYEDALVDVGGIAIGTIGSYVAETIEMAEFHKFSANTNGARGSFQHTIYGLRGLKSVTRSGTLNGVEALRKALYIDPDYARAHALLARGYVLAWRFDWDCKLAQPLETALEHARRAVQLDPVDPVCETQLGFCHFWAGEIDRAIFALERAARMKPDCSDIAGDLGMVLSYCGRSDEAIDILNRSLKTDETDPDYRLWSLGDAYFAKGDHTTAITTLNRMRDPTQSYRLLAACTARLGDDPRAYVDRLLRFQPDFSIRRWIAIQPMMNAVEKADYADALSLAGLPA